MASFLSQTSFLHCGILANIYFENVLFSHTFYGPDHVAPQLVSPTKCSSRPNHNRSSVSCLFFSGSQTFLAPTELSTPTVFTPGIFNRTLGNQTQSITNSSIWFSNRTSLFQAPRETRKGECEGTKTRGNPIIEHNRTHNEFGQSSVRLPNSCLFDFGFVYAIYKG